jgi:uncharacterized protein (DUF433 family)
MADSIAVGGKMRAARIINRGRGPEIEGTRITVYDIWDYAKENWHRDAIATWLRLSSAQVAVALDYIEDHKAEVLAAYERILERERHGNPPELQAKLDAIREESRALRAARKAQQAATAHD